nr:PREDICTED: tetraspanin-32-like [Lepisosteus oculatus]
MEQQGYTRIIKLQILIHSCLILVESAAKDIYDRLCHDFAVNQTAQVKEHLAAIHSADCLLAIGHFLHKHLDICWTLILATATIALSGLFLTSSLYFSVRLAESWNRKGKYTLAGFTDSM